MNKCARPGSGQARSSDSSLPSSFWRSAVMRRWAVSMSLSKSPSERLLIQGPCKRMAASNVCLPCRSERRVAPAGDAGWPRMRRALQRAIASAVVKGPVDFRWALQRAHGAGIPCWSRYCRQILAYALRVSHFSALNDRFEAAIDHALAVEWHGIPLGLHAGIRHHLVPSRLAHLL
jgi:hypothetical protein